MNPSDIIRAAIDENPLDVQNTVSDLMLNKIRDAVDLRKIEMAQQFFDAVPEDGWDNEEDEETYDDSDEEEFEDEEEYDDEEEFEDEEEFDDEDGYEAEEDEENQ